jgi:hypothetical protein
MVVGELEHLVLVTDVIHHSKDAEAMIVNRSAPGPLANERPVIGSGPLQTRRDATVLHCSS